jgi:hypothetical protein
MLCNVSFIISYSHSLSKVFHYSFLITTRKVKVIESCLVRDRAGRRADVQIKCTRKCTSRMQYNGGASARSNPQGIVFLKANLNLN